MQEDNYIKVELGILIDKKVLKKANIQADKIEVKFKKRRNSYKRRGSI